MVLILQETVSTFFNVLSLDKVWKSPLLNVEHDDDVTSIQIQPADDVDLRVPFLASGRLEDVDVVEEFAQKKH